MRILLVKPSPRLGTIRGLQAFQRLEPLELGYLAAAAPPGQDIRVLDLRRRRFPEPMRVERRPIVPADIVRALVAERAYVRGYERLYRDYPRALWE